MISDLLSQLFKLLNGKNVSYVVLLIITILSGYFVFNVITVVMQDNKTLISSLEKVDVRLSEILRVLKDHEQYERQEIRFKK